jgi:hypothetical protein
MFYFGDSLSALDFSKNVSESLSLSAQNYTSWRDFQFSVNVANVKNVVEQAVRLSLPKLLAIS